MEIQDIKQQLTIEMVLNYYNLSLKNSHCKCPFHKDDTPSLRIYPETNTYYCFGCEKTGDVIQFIQDIEALAGQVITKHKAIMKAKSLLATELPIIKTNPQQEVSPFGGDLEGAYLKMKQSLHRSKKAIAYLETRAIYDTQLEQGYNNGRVFKHLKECIVYPLKDEQGKVVSLYGRSIIQKSEAEGKHYYLKNRCGLYPNYPTAETKTLVLTESIIDATTILKYTDYKVLALFGTNGLTLEHTEAVSQLSNLQEIILFFDGDTAGRKANTTVANKLHSILPKVTISKVNTPDDEDVNSLVLSHEPTILNHLIKQVVPAGNTTNNQEQATSNQQLDTKNPEYIVYTTPILEITILGGIPIHNLDKLKVTLRINPQNNTNPFYILRQSHIDLYDDDALNKLIRKVTERLELGTKETQSVLYALIALLEDYRLHQLEVYKPEEIKAHQISEAEKYKAFEFLKAPDLLKRTNELIGKTGLVGEENNRLLMYLVFTSRLREQPLHIISLGASGTGKTYLQEKISALVPEADRLEITALSENALYYFDRTELKNKLVLIEDLDGAQDDKILYAIRELMSKKRISKTIPIKDNKGNLKTVTLQVEGPITLAGTTTKEKIYEDNANRSILIYLDNSNKQKQAIITYQQKLSAGLIDKVEEQKAVHLLQNIQSVLEPIKVRNPYATQLNIPETVFKPLRTNAHYLSFIEVVTFYCQRQRSVSTDKQTNQKYIETTLEDIQIANSLLKEVLLTKSDELTKGCRNFFEAVKRHLAKEKKTTFYSNQIRTAFRMSPSNVKYYLAVLNKYHLVKVIGGHPRKQGYEYEVISNEEYQNLKERINVLDDILSKLKLASG